MLETNDPAAAGRASDRMPGVVARPAGAPAAEGGETAREAKKYFYWVQLVNGFGSSSRSFVVVFECLHATTADIDREMRQHGAVNGSRLDTVDDGKGGRLIRKRADFMFGVAGLVSVQPYHKPCWEPAE